MENISTFPPTYAPYSIALTLTPPRTPPGFNRPNRPIHHWPEPETFPEEPHPDNTYGDLDRLENSVQRRPDEESENALQDVLLLHGAKQRYVHTRNYPVPKVKGEREMLVKVEVVGLNPIDWKAPDFGFGLPPEMPCISGRDFAGRVIKNPEVGSRFKVGDRILGISTDYRDSRKSAFQQYAIVSDYNACNIPTHLSSLTAAPLGVAFVAAALALGICIGVDFSEGKNGIRGPDILRRIRSFSREELPEDIRSECFDSIREEERIRPGEWIAIWGGSSATGCCAVQLAKLAGLKVAAIINVARSGERMLRHGADLLIDRLDTDRAISIVKGVTKGKLRFALDTQGRESALLLTKALQTVDTNEESSISSSSSSKRSHLIGLVGLPKAAMPGIVFHTVPIKVFHEAPSVGEEMMRWLEELLEREMLEPLEIEVAEGGLEGVNEALDRLRDGSVNGPRIVVPLIP